MSKQLIKEYEKLKAKSAEIKLDEARLLGQQEQIIATLTEKFGVSTKEAAEVLLADTKEELESIKSEYETELRKLKQLWAAV